MEEILKKFWEAGVMHEATLDSSRYSFEKTLSDNAQALQLLQHEVMRCCSECGQELKIHSDNRPYCANIKCTAVFQ